MSDDRFPYLKNFLKPTRGGSAISDKTLSEELSALLAPDSLVRPEKNFSSGPGDLYSIPRDDVPGQSSRHPHPCRNHTPTTEAPQASAPERTLTCYSPEVSMTEVISLENHPAADAFPMMDANRFQELLQDIKEHG